MIAIKEKAIPVLTKWYYFLFYSLAFIPSQNVLSAPAHRKSSFNLDSKESAIRAKAWGADFFHTFASVMKNVLFIMLGGAVGSALRYLTSLACQSIRWLNMPWGTLAVNVIGCFLLGLLIGLGERYTTFPKEIYLMLTVGLCGSFTTFSTFASDFFRLNNSGQIWLALVYLTVSIIVGFLLFGLGRYIVVR